MQMSPEGYARWKDVVATYTALENNRKLTDAQVEVLQGYAQMLRQSGINIKVDTKEGINFHHPLYWWPTDRPHVNP
jgi:ABC-type transport system substrate-binding protein